MGSVNIGYLPSPFVFLVSFDHLLAWCYLPPSRRGTLSGLLLLDPTLFPKQVCNVNT